MKKAQYGATNYAVDSLQYTKALRRPVLLFSMLQKRHTLWNMSKLKVFLMKFLKKLIKIPNHLSIVVIRIYRLVLSPSVGVLRHIPFYPRPTCIFYPSCSEYSIICFKKENFPTAFKKTVRRISRCHPGNDPQVDLP